MNRPWVRTATVLSAFAAVFITLTVTGYTQKSATWDEPQHLITGYAMLAHRDYRIDPEHPPLLRMWAALPLMFDGTVKLDSTIIDQLDPGYWVGMGQFKYAHHSLYKQNDADRLLYRARFMVVLLGVGLGVLLFSWARELFGFWTAVVVLTLYCLEPNLLAHASLVTTDFGATCFMFGTLYFLWRFSRQRSVANAAGSNLFFTLAMVSKFTVIMLAPVIVVLLMVDSYRQPNRLRSLGISAGILASMLATSSMYPFRYHLRAIRFPLT